MKIKGVVKQGKNTGDPIEWSAEEKVPLALQDALEAAESAKEYRQWVRDVKIETLTSNTKGDLIKGKWQNNIYAARGEMTVHKRSITKDIILNPKKYSFYVEFEDYLDPNHQPDLKINSLVLG